MKLLKIFVLLLTVSLLGCPPPGRAIYIKTNGEWSDRVNINREGLSVLIRGFYQPSMFEDKIILEIKIKPVAQISDRNVLVESNRFELASDGCYMVKKDVFHVWTFDKHENFLEMTPEAFADYTDSLYMKIYIDGIFSEPFCFDVDYDHDWLKKRFNKIKK